MQHESVLRARIIDLTLRLEKAEGQLAFYKDALGIGAHERYQVLGLTGYQAMFLACLARRDIATRQQIMVALYGDRSDDEVDPKICDVWVCKIRPVLKRHGIQIENVWGRGWRIDAASKAKLAALVDPPLDHT